MIVTPSSVSRPPTSSCGESDSPSSSTPKVIENTGDSVVSGVTLVTG